MARRSEHSMEEIKAMVLNAAETIVIEEGVAALKVRKVAMTIGYTVGSVYRVFENMADLILQIQDRAVDDLALSLSGVDDSETPEQCIKQLAKAYLAFANCHFNRWRMIFTQAAAADRELPAWYRQKVETLSLQLEKQIKRLSPELPKDRIERGAEALWSGIHGVCTLALTGPCEQNRLDAIEHTIILLIENFLYGWTEGRPVIDRRQSK